MIIGKTATFIRQEWRNGDHHPPTNLQFTGVILDKIIGIEKIEGKNWRAEYYLVLLPNNVVAKFFCDEIVSIEKVDDAIEKQNQLKLI